MGIQGLLRFLKDATTEIHIREYSGRCVAVDTYCWLHRGAFACADKLAKGEKTDQYVNYCMKFVGMLESYNVRPVLVFDGCHLPSKREVEKQRRERRELYMQKGKQFLREGRLGDARDAFTKCISVTPRMALEVMKAARARGVDCIVAPYEADAQLAYLLKHGYAQAVVTEDSDLLCFGCEKVILKMDLTGRAQEVSIDKFENVKNLQGFTLDTFRHMCIISGCDYLPNIKGVGLVKSCKALKLAKNKEIYQAVRKLHLYIKGLNPVEAEYAIGFERADKTFLYQLVLDPRARKLVPLHPYPPDVMQEDVKYAGPLLSEAQALQIAWGNMDVNNGKKMGDFDADVWLSRRRNSGSSILRTSIWQKDYLASAKPEEGKVQNGGKKNTIKMPSLRGHEAVIDVRNLLHAKKKKGVLLDGEEALKLCSQAPDNSNGSIKSKIHGEREKERNVKVDPVDICAPSELSRKASPQQRAETKKNSGTNYVVKSRFFSASDDGPSFIEESDASPIPQVDETPETSNSSLVNNTETVEGDEALREILQEMQSESASELPPTKPQKQPSFSSIKSPKKQKELLLKLLEFQRQNEIRTPLGPSRLQTALENKIVAPAKRKNPFSVSNQNNTSTKARRKSPRKKTTPPCLKKFKRTVIKPPSATTDCKRGNPPLEDGGRELCFSLTEELDDDKKERLDASIISNEAIPILDKKISSNYIKKLPKILLRESTCEIDSENVVKRRISYSPTKHSKNWDLSPEDSKTGKIIETTDEDIIKRFNSEPIILSSDEENENIPLLDNLPDTIQKRQITVGLSRKTPPQMSRGLVKSKYFGDAKVSGLRKRDSLNKPKKKSMEILKTQPKITSMFSKTTTKNYM